MHRNAPPADPEDSGKLSPNELADYLLEIGGMLVSYGCPSSRLEEVIRVVAEIEGCTAQAFAIPTGLFLSLAAPSGAAPVVRMIRVKEWGTNLDRLVLVDRIFNDVAADRITIGEARRQLVDLDQRAPPYPAALQWVAAAALSAAAAVFFRGGAHEVVVAGMAGVLVALFASLAGRNPKWRFLLDFVGGLIAAL